MNFTPPASYYWRGDFVMANPQLENGYTKISNEIFDAMVRWKFSSYEYRILIFLIRKTYGWNKKKDWISLSQFVEGTGIKKAM